MFFQGWKARAYKGMAPQRQDQEQSRRNARFRCMYETTVKRTDGQELRRKELGSNFLGAGLSLLATLIGLIVDRKSAVQGKSVDLGGRRIIKKKDSTDDQLNVEPALLA